jgi:5-methylcytosine-specific restriction endonuclease McrA
MAVGGNATCVVCAAVFMIRANNQRTCSAKCSCEFQAQQQRKRSARLPVRVARTLILDRDGNVCAYCREWFRSEALCIDHIVPVASGGSSEPQNLITACAACNKKKSSSRLSPADERALLRYAAQASDRLDWRPEYTAAVEGAKRYKDYGKAGNK